MSENKVAVAVVAGVVAVTAVVNAAGAYVDAKREETKAECYRAAREAKLPAAVANCSKS